MSALKLAMYEIVFMNRPCSVRQVYYMGIGRLWDKDSGGSRKTYNMVTRVLGDMREAGELPWGWLTDSTRYVRIDRMYGSLDEGLEDFQESFRRDLWRTQPTKVEVWAESDSTASLLEPVTRPLGVPLFSCRGQAGKEFAHAAAVAYQRTDKPVKILYAGDWDPAGLGIPKSLLERLERYTAGAVQVDLHRLAVTPEDVARGDLTSHGVNTSDPNYATFVEACRNLVLAPQIAVEVEAIPPPVLRQRLEDQLYALIDDPRAWNITLAAEESERTILGRMVGTVRQ